MIELMNNNILIIPKIPKEKLYLILGIVSILVFIILLELLINTNNNQNQGIYITSNSMYNASLFKIVNHTDYALAIEKNGNTIIKQYNASQCYNSKTYMFVPKNGNRYLSVITYSNNTAVEFITVPTKGGEVEYVVNCS